METHGTPAFWPYLRWSAYLFQTAIITAPIWFATQFRFLHRTAAMSLVEVAWLVCALLWLAAFVLYYVGSALENLGGFAPWVGMVLDFLGFMLWGILGFVQLPISLVAILTSESTRFLRKPRRPFRWTEALAAFSLVILSINAIVSLDAMGHI